MSEVHLLQGDAAQVLTTLADSSVDLILTDPPYYKVKGDYWDRQWDTPQGFLDWLDTILEQYYRILKPNGSLYMFASPQMSDRVSVLIRERFNVLNNITWSKPGKPYAEKYNPENFRHFTDYSERIIFAEHYGADEECSFVFTPLKKYFYEAWGNSGVPKEDVINVFRTDGRYTSDESATVHAAYKIGWGNGMRWDLCDEKLYSALGSVLPLRLPYTEIRRQYEDLKQQYEDLRRPFSVTADVPYTDVWTFKTVSAYPGKHPCEKPLDMLEHIIKTSSRPGAVVLDSFMGTGNTGKAAVKLGRSFTGIERDAKYFAKAEERITQAQMVMPL